MTSSVALLAFAGCQGAYSSGAVDVVGNYSSVTESHCNLELDLFDDATVRLVERCAGERDPMGEQTNSRTANWSRSGDVIVVQHRDAHDTLRYNPALSYGSFGKSGAGPALTFVGSSSGSSRLAGYGQVWKMPLTK